MGCTASTLFKDGPLGPGLSSLSPYLGFTRSEKSESHHLATKLRSVLLRPHSDGCVASGIPEPRVIPCVVLGVDRDEE
jgi:hypothetical protein